MCRVYLIWLLICLVYVRDSSASGSVCKNDLNKNIQSLTIYNIENCTNTEIDLGAENAKASLNSIKARNNQISKISDDTFKSAKQLTSIDLSENKIEQISVGAFEDQGKLEFLYLKQNKLTRIEVGTFDSLLELKELWLQNNQLSLLEKGLFDQNTKLENLFLRKNKIIAIESTVFAKLNAIKSLTLKDNICTNLNYNSNKFDRDFNCFAKYESFFRPHLNRVEQCRTEKELCDQGYSTCQAKEDLLNKNLSAKVNELSEVGKNLSDCQRDNTTVHQEKDQLTEQLQICESKPENDTDKSQLYILISVKQSNCRSS
jgi:Leucine-rich repeat (LRR) protein